MLKEALSMILGPWLIFCINYIQRKLKRCFSRAQHFYAYTPLARSTMEKLNFTSGAVFSRGLELMCGSIARFLQQPQNGSFGEAVSHTMPPQTTVATAGGGSVTTYLGLVSSQISHRGKLCGCPWTQRWLPFCFIPRLQAGIFILSRCCLAAQRRLWHG